ncbi:aspartate dehydrogenase [Shinella zoogloeoides]|uniref:aspartate dehydrogenase n=1 Tax=Shinella zoogloeoides TaxID=352475 RepID=UPI000E6496E4|nr:aspartate dehydrogenase [Shinella zoogloeoides]
MSAVPAASALRLCLIGSGAIGERVATLLAARPKTGIELVGIVTRPGASRCDWWPVGCRQITDPVGLAALAPDLVVEAASRQAVQDWGDAALHASRELILCSASALTDDDLRDRLTATAVATGSQLLIANGALGGIQAISAASLRPLSKVTHVIRKPPMAWRGTAAERIFDSHALDKVLVFFRGSAREAASTFPANANAVVTTALASMGLDQTRVELVADPEIDKNIHQLHATGDFGSLSLTIANEPMPSNPKTSDMTALSIAQMLLARTAPLVV